MEINYKKIKLENLSLGYLDTGSPKITPKGTILLLHGFGSTAKVNWLETGWIDFLYKQGFRCIAPDHRGHGVSDKFYNPEDYGPDIFAKDTKDLLEHIGIKKCVVLGFSMGARIAAWCCYAYPDYFKAGIFGGMGICMIKPHRDYEAVAKAFETDEPANITDKAGIAFRAFAERTGSDRFALAACIRPSRQCITKDILAKIKMPVLVAVGDKDEVGGSPFELKKLLSGSAFVEAISLEGYDHMRSSGCQPFKQATLEFLEKFV